MAVWDDVLGDTDRKVFEAAGWGRPAGLGARPVLLVIDVNYNFVGDRPDRSSTPSSAGATPAASAAGGALPPSPSCWSRPGRCVCRSPTPPTRAAPTASTWACGTSRAGGRPTTPTSRATSATRSWRRWRPPTGDLFVEKKKPSAFFGTPLVDYLVALRADTLLLCGTTTSGCVPFSAVDAISYNFRVGIPEPCV